ncbi:MAG: SCP2 sterol-binding domain-containing protein [Gammaproteobacteria bacterium]|nr:SCP2 sterol-binding domain-containing protein [Gammaproteobacteria bacterium]
MKAQITDALLDALNAAAGEILSLDPDGRRRLAGLQGKVLCIEVAAPPLTLYVLPAATGIEFRRHLDGGAAPDVTLSGSAVALANLARGATQHSNDAHEPQRRPRVVVRGDAELGQAFRKIIAELDLDWEELLARALGDTPARKVGNALRQLGGWAGESFDLARENAADYLAEEKRIFATDAAMRRFDREVDRARADVDRLTRRVEHLQQTLDRRSRSRH